MVAKLFAKHIKLREAVDYVKKTRYFSSFPPLGTRYSGANPSRMGIGVGTPSRIIDLLDSGMLPNVFNGVMHQFAVSHRADFSRRIIIVKSGTGSG